MTLLLKVKVAMINGEAETVYPYQDKDYPDLSSRLRAEYEKQGNFYEKHVKGFSKSTEQEKRLLNWHELDSDFSSICDGWKKAISDNFKINKAVVISERKITIE